MERGLPAPKGHLGSAGKSQRAQFRTRTTAPRGRCRSLGRGQSTAGRPRSHRRRANRQDRRLARFRSSPHA
eukprot:7389594-Prymnesium_polylepis.1